MKNKGQALITLLFFTVIAINVTAAAVVIIMINSLSGTKFQQGSIAYEIAQAGIEEAKIRLLRDPDYTGETLTVGNGSAVITVSKNGSNYTVLSKGTVGNFKRQIQVDARYDTNEVFIVDSEEEVFQ
jgi:type II secretory pathway component PulK